MKFRYKTKQPSMNFEKLSALSLRATSKRNKIKIVDIPFENKNYSYQILEQVMLISNIQKINYIKNEDMIREELAPVVIDNYIYDPKFSGYIYSMFKAENFDDVFLLDVSEEVIKILLNSYNVVVKDSHKIYQPEEIVELEHLFKCLMHQTMHEEESERLMELVNKIPALAEAVRHGTNFAGIQSAQETVKSIYSHVLPTTIHILHSVYQPIYSQAHSEYECETKTKLSLMSADFLRVLVRTAATDVQISTSYGNKLYTITGKRIGD